MDLKMSCNTLHKNASNNNPFLFHNSGSISSKSEMENSHKILINIPEENENDSWNEDNFQNELIPQFHTGFSNPVGTSHLIVHKSLTEFDIPKSNLNSLTEQFQAINLNDSPVSNFTYENSSTTNNDSVLIIPPRRRNATISAPMFDQ